MIFMVESTTMPKNGGLNCDRERVFEKTMLFAEPRKRQSLFFD
jgi:hypothetical protein